MLCLARFVRRLTVFDDEARARAWKDRRREGPTKSVSVRTRDESAAERLAAVSRQPAVDPSVGRSAGCSFGRSVSQSVNQSVSQWEELSGWLQIVVVVVDVGISGLRRPATSSTRGEGPLGSIASPAIGKGRGGGLSTASLEDSLLH